MMDIGIPCRETISLMYHLVRVSILSVSQIGMKCADLVRRLTMTQIVLCPFEVLGTSNALSIPRKFSALMFSFLKASATTFAFQVGNESHNHNLQAILAYGVVSCSILSDQEYAEGFYDH
ncbi:hypothetical protein Tco_1036687 [Tanacetum coccineum]